MIVHHLVLANAEAVKSPVIPQIAEIIVGLVAFSLLFLLLRSKAVPKFEQAFRERTDAIQGGIERAEAAQQEAASALASYKAQLADAKGEAQKMREEARVGLEKSKGFMRKEIGSRIRLRKTPELLFEIDTSVEYGSRIDELLRNLNKD